MYLLDTDTLTLIDLGHPRTVARLLQVNPEEVAITVITRIEILQGRFAAVRKAAGTQELLLAQEESHFAGPFGRYRIPEVPGE